MSKKKSVAIGNAWIGRFSFLIQKQNAISIQHSITNARQKEIRNGVKVNHSYSNEFLDPDRIANVYFTSDVDAKNRIRSLNEFCKINLNAIRRDGMHDDGVFNDCLINDHDFDDETASINSNMSVMENIISNDAFDSQLELMDDEDYDDND